MNKFKVASENENGTTAQIVVEPLEQGYGHTLGNSLRRCMLTSMPGAAITSLKIAGVSHQFSTMPGVVEDVLQIILNLKKLRLKIYGDQLIHLSIQKTGKGDITAGDLDTKGLGEIINPDLHIATVTDPKAKFSLELTADKGVGYVGVDERKSNEVGVMPIDSIYTPVLSVNYTVDQTRVGRRTDFEKLTMDITTDGTMTALEAVNSSAQILAGYFQQIYKPEADDQVVATPADSFLAEDLLKSSVEELDLPVRISNALKAIDADTIGKLTQVPRAHLMKAKNLGTKSLTLISEKLAERGLALSEA